jgi:hypothetical protein
LRVRRAIIADRELEGRKLVEVATGKPGGGGRERTSGGARRRRGLSRLWT